jgi:hypothetical protein
MPKYDGSVKTSLSAMLKAGLNESRANAGSLVVGCDRDGTESHRPNTRVSG